MDWPHVLSAVVSVVVARRVTQVLSRSAGRTPPVENGVVVLRHSKALRAILACGVLLGAALSAFFVWRCLDVFEPRRFACAILGAPLLLGLAVGACFEFRVRFEIDGDGIRGRTAFRGWRAIAWADLVDVQFSRRWECLVLHDRHGEVLRVHRVLEGSDRIAAILEEKLPEEVWRHAVAEWRKVGDGRAALRRAGESGSRRRGATGGRS